MAKDNLNALSMSETFTQDQITSRIYTVRGVQVMLDRDLAVFFQVETGNLNKAVKRNQERFPEDFMFQLTKDEWLMLNTQIGEYNDGLLFQFGRAKNTRGGSRYCPYVFTEQGVSQLSGVLRSNIAVQMSIKITRAFVTMRKFVMNYAALFQRVESVELRQIVTDQKVSEILSKLDDSSDKIKTGIFFDNQMFDALVLLEEIVKKAKTRILLIDDYVDARILDLFHVHAPQATVDVYVKPFHQTSTMRQTFVVFHRQYPSVHCELHDFTLSHDRWLFVDNTLYHFGASLKDLGARWFCCSVIEDEMVKGEILRILNQNHV